MQWEGDRPRSPEILNRLDTFPSRHTATEDGRPPANRGGSKLANEKTRNVPATGVKRALASERGVSPWAQALSGKERGEAALSGERGQAPWARALSGKERGEAALSGERGQTPWARALSGKEGVKRALASERGVSP